MTGVPPPRTTAASIYAAVVTSHGLPTLVNGARILLSAYRPAPPTVDEAPRRPTSVSAPTVTPVFDLLAAEWQPPGNAGRS